MSVTKRSVSLESDIADAVERAAAEDGVSFSTWLSQSARRELKRRDGLFAIECWEAEAGPLTPHEIAHGERVLDRLLRPTTAS
jgi:hypothetical protein